MRTQQHKAIALLLVFWLALGRGGGAVLADTGSSSTSSGPLGIASEFNLFVHGDLTMTNSDTEGRAAVGGNASFENYRINSHSVHRGKEALAVGGNLTFTNGQINGGDAVYGDTFSGSGIGIPDGTLRQGSVIDFDQARSELYQLTGHYASLPTNGDVETNPGHSDIVLKGTDPVLNVFQVDKDLGEIRLDVPADSTVIINIYGTNRTMDSGDYLNFNAKKVLFNFPETTDLEILNVDVKGSLLAPYAAVKTTYSHIDGTLVADTITGHIETRHFPFEPELPPSEPSLENPVPSLESDPAPSLEPSPEPSLDSNPVSSLEPNPGPSQGPFPGPFEDEEIIIIEDNEIPVGNPNEGITDIEVPAGNPNDKNDFEEPPSLIEREAPEQEEEINVITDDQKTPPGTPTEGSSSQVPLSKLPQTGETSRALFYLSGFILIAIGIALGFAKKRKS
ncbi:choice-of-anchor A family protein [Paenibacillus senegalensis]|uniref:choice-of-anchor A family protein n=1 Tax=Paenibacillus senegalensis TaxID=1465766 RepID=UPI0002896E0D|nr:choice-of-anchor A family protein [Paenibacillus senegalensis]